VCTHPKTIRSHDYQRKRERLKREKNPVDELLHKARQGKVVSSSHVTDLEHEASISPSQHADRLRSQQTSRTFLITWKSKNSSLMILP